jgi:hypothetical protein
VRAREWAAAFEREYLDSYLPAGGATIRFVSGLPHAIDVARSEVTGAAERRGFLTFQVDARDTKLHLIQELFFAVSRKVDWDDLTLRVAEATVRDLGYGSPTRQELSYSAIAAANAGMEINDVRVDLRRKWSRDVFRDYSMVAEFRLAMMALLHDLLSEESESDRAHAIRDWLTGELRSINPLKSALIYQRISRGLARDMLVSTFHWVRKAGFPGCVLCIDIGAYLTAHRGDASGLFYTRAACLEMYEVIRQFIDSVDELEGCGIVFLAPHGWPLDEVRGLPIYRALHARVNQEVRDQRRANPVDILVRVV